MIITDPIAPFVALIEAQLPSVRASGYETFSSATGLALGADGLPLPRVFIDYQEGDPVGQIFDGSVECIRHLLIVTAISYSREASHSLMSAVNSILLASALDVAVNIGPLYTYDSEDRTHSVAMIYNHLN